MKRHKNRKISLPYPAQPWVFRSEVSGYKSTGKQQKCTPTGPDATCILFNKVNTGNNAHKTVGTSKNID